MKLFSNDSCSYCGGQVAAFVSADPAQAADNIEHLELELKMRKKEECYKWLPFRMKMYNVKDRQNDLGKIKRLQTFILPLVITGSN